MDGVAPTDEFAEAVLLLDDRLLHGIYLGMPVLTAPAIPLTATTSTDDTVNETKRYERYKSH